LGTPIDVSTALALEKLAIEEKMQPILQRRLLFSLLFVFGTLAAAYGWLAEIQRVPMTVYITVGGHVAQVIGLLGSMMTPDRIEGQLDDRSELEESDTDFLTKGF
jgi:hypothetical protein